MLYVLELVNDKISLAGLSPNKKNGLKNKSPPKLSSMECPREKHESNEEHVEAHLESLKSLGYDMLL